MALRCFAGGSTTGLSATDAHGTEPYPVMEENVPRLEKVHDPDPRVRANIKGRI